MRILLQNAKFGISPAGFRCYVGAMYENLIKQQPLSKPNNFSVRLPAMPVSEKAAYVHSVCSALIDERFGRRMGLFIVDLSESPESEDAVFCELTVDGSVPFYTFLLDPEMARRDVADITRQKLARVRTSAAKARSQHRSPSNLGRGSPKISLGRIVSEPPAAVAGLPQHWHVFCARTAWLNMTNSNRLSLGRTPMPDPGSDKKIDL